METTPCFLRKLNDIMHFAFFEEFWRFLKGFVNDISSLLLESFEQLLLLFYFYVHIESNLLGRQVAFNIQEIVIYIKIYNIINTIEIGGFKNLPRISRF